MKKKTVVLSIFLLIIIIIIYIIFISNNKNDISELFIVKDINDVKKVLLIDNKDSLLLEKNIENNTWVLNNKYPVTNKAINKLEQTLAEVKINKPVRKEITDSVSSELLNKGTVIQIFNKRNKIIKEWIIGEYEESSEGTYILDKNIKKPYIVNIPGLENDLNYRYNTNSLYWIKAEVFAYQPNEILEIGIKYTDNPKKSFTIKIKGEEAEIYLSENNYKLKSINYNKVGSYLSYFMNVKFSSFYNESQRDSVFSNKPNFIINVKDIYKREKNVKLYKIKNNKNQVQYNPFKLNAIINDEDLVVVKYVDIDLILKDPEYFIK